MQFTVLKNTDRKPDHPIGLALSNRSANEAGSAKKGFRSLLENLPSGPVPLKQSETPPQLPPGGTTTNPQIRAGNRELSDFLFRKDLDSLSLQDLAVILPGPMSGQPEQGTRAQEEMVTLGTGEHLPIPSLIAGPTAELSASGAREQLAGPSGAMLMVEPVATAVRQQPLNFTGPATTGEAALAAGGGPAVDSTVVSSTGEVAGTTGRGPAANSMVPETAGVTGATGRGPAVDSTGGREGAFGDLSGKAEPKSPPVSNQLPSIPPQTAADTVSLKEEWKLKTSLRPDSGFFASSPREILFFRQKGPTGGDPGAALSKAGGPVQAPLLEVRTESFQDQGQSSFPSKKVVDEQLIPPTPEMSSMKNAVVNAPDYRPGQPAMLTPGQPGGVPVPGPIEDGVGLMAPPGGQPREASMANSPTGAESPAVRTWSGEFLPAEVDQALGQIVQRARLLNQTATKSLEIRLQPALLGRIKIATVQDADQTLSATILVEEPRVRLLLESQMASLMTQLEEAGLELKSVTLQDMGADDEASSPSHADHQKGPGESQEGEQEGTRQEDSSDVSEPMSQRGLDDGRMHYFA